MTNEYGMRLDSNGYVPSLIGDRGVCYRCGRFGELQRHEIFHHDFGGKTRDKSKAYGLWVSVCQPCHAYMHKHPKEFYEDAQKIAMEHYGWSVEEFRKRFGKSYI